MSDVEKLQIPPTTSPNPSSDGNGTGGLASSAAAELEIRRATALQNAAVGGHGYTLDVGAVLVYCNASRSREAYRCSL
jgi:hypothetical protein